MQERDKMWGTDPEGQVVRDQRKVIFTALTTASFALPPTVILEGVDWDRSVNSHGRGMNAVYFIVAKTILFYF